MSIKGDWDRTKDKKKFDENFEKINWRKKEVGKSVNSSLSAQDPLRPGEEQSQLP